MSAETEAYELAMKHGAVVFKGDALHTELTMTPQVLAKIVAQVRAEAGQEAAADRKIGAVYDRLHEGKIGAHWLWCVIEQIAAGVPEAEAFKCYGYYEAGPSRKRFDASRAAAVQAVGVWRPMSEFPPLGSVLMWNVTANRLHPAMSYRIGHPVLENCCDCSHWMPLPAPPTALSGSLGDGGGRTP